MRWQRADLHLQTTCSDGKPTLEELARRLARTSLAVAAVTDHDTVDGALRVEQALAGTGPEIVVGSEVSSRDGHVLALFVIRDFPPGMSAEATIDAIHEQGGLAVAAHPYSLAEGVGDLAARLPFDGVEIVNRSPLMALSNARAVCPPGKDVRCPVRRIRRACRLGGRPLVHTLFRGAGAADLRAALLAGQTQPAVDWRQDAWPRRPCTSAG